VRRKGDGLCPLEAVFDVARRPPDRFTGQGFPRLLFAGAVILARDLTA